MWAVAAKQLAKVPGGMADLRDQPLRISGLYKPLIRQTRPLHIEKLHLTSRASYITVYVAINIHRVGTR